MIEFTKTFNLAIVLAISVLITLCTAVRKMRPRPEMLANLELDRREIYVSGIVVCGLEEFLLKRLQTDFVLYICDNTAVVINDNKQESSTNTEIYINTVHKARYKCNLLLSEIYEHIRTVAVYYPAFAKANTLIT